MLRDLGGPGAVAALLGPTNTGKTHAAIRRMLSYRTGMIGLPLRLLAREVYDRVSAEVGEEQVALVTGEEKRVPARARYWVCTTESMPVERPVDFLALDEVQLVAHPERGHVYTQRVLRARGFRETWMMGSDTVEPLLRGLAPTVTVERRERLSRLSWGGVRGLGRLPPKSAVIAFSAGDVFSLAEAVRRQHGGVAVVLGALSPRTRNAQVALVQSGEVPYLVATDAIGMGLNLDIDHVAFSALSKWDGRRRRPLELAELAQIAGRAGRYRRDGTFGTLDSVGELPPDAILALEMHRFPPLRTANWRNDELDYASLASLSESLAVRPRGGHLRMAPRTTDVEALRQLAAHPDVIARASSPARVALLWDICRLPDFQATLTGDHLALLLTIWRQLTGPREALDPDWLAAEIGPLDQPDGDLETLLVRISQIRTWTSIAFHAEWVPDRGWQERTREIEDRLSEALHQRLVARFVDRRLLALGSASSARLEGGQVEAAGHALGELRGLRFEAAIAGDRAGLRVARERLAEDLARRVELLVAAPHEAVQLGPDGALSWEGGRLGRLVAGDGPLLPQVRLDELPLIGPGARSRVHRRLVAWCRDAVARLYAPIREADPEALGRAGRALLYALEQGLGAVWRDEVAAELGALSDAERAALGRMGLRFGTAVVYCAWMLDPAAIRLRALLWAVARGRDPLDAGSAASFPYAGDPAALLPMGYAPVAGRAVRVDRVESALARLRSTSREGAFEAPASLIGLLEIEPGELAAVVEALGYPRRPDGLHLRPRPERHGPPRRRSA